MYCANDRGLSQIGHSGSALSGGRQTVNHKAFDQLTEHLSISNSPMGQHWHFVCSTILVVYNDTVSFVVVVNVAVVIVVAAVVPVSRVPGRHYKFAQDINLDPR